MPNTLYQNQTKEISYELWFRNRDKTETRPTVASGLFMLLDPSGNVVVPSTSVTISSTNKATFLARPTSGTGAIGIYTEVWDLFVNNGATVESFQHVDIMTIKERI
jgi:hypothetical protein